MKERAKRGRQIVHNATRRKKSIDSVGEVLLELIHYCNDEESLAHFQLELAWAQQNFDAENKK